MPNSNNHKLGFDFSPGSMFKDALSLSLARLEENPNDVEVLIDTAFSYWCCSQEFQDSSLIDQGLKYVDKALMINPDDTRGNCVKGELLSAKRQYSNAIPYYQKAYRVNNSNKGAITGLAVANYALQNYDKSITYLDILLEMDPSDSEAWFLKGSVLTRMKRLNEAKICLEQDQILGSQEASEMISEIKKYESRGCMTSIFLLLFGFR